VNKTLGAIVFFGTGLLVMLVYTRWIFRKSVPCPICGGSLWDCGTGNFKPRRMRVRNDALCCPHCHADIV